MISDREYVFASSLIKSSEGKGSPRERLNRFREASDTASLRNAVAEAFGVSVSNPYDEAINAAVKLCRDALPDEKLIHPLLYKYDCANIKTAIKCKIRNIPSDGLLYTCGTIPTAKIIAAAESSDFSDIPGEMGKAAEQALKTFQKTGEVRAIDLTVDRACFADMAKTADEFDCELVEKIVKIRADGVNFLTALRISAEAMPSDIAASLFERAFVPGGEIPKSAFCSKESGIYPKDKIASAAGGASSDAVRRAAEEDDADAAVKVIDEAIIKLCADFRYKPFGPEVAVALVVIREAEITNCRIIEAAMGEALSEELLKERLREAYV